MTVDVVHDHPIEIRLAAPFMTRANRIGSFGVDSPLAVDDDDRPYLPGTHVLGKIREALQHLADALGDDGPGGGDFLGYSERWFGGTGDEEKGHDLRTRIFITDLPLVADDAPADRPEDRTAMRTRIAINPATGTAVEAALQVIEDRWLPGTGLTFRGRIRIIGTAEEVDEDQVRLWIERALAWTTQMGAMRTVGFGVMTGAAIGDRDALTIAASPLTRTARVNFELRFDQPFCLPVSRNSSNTYISGDVVPGAVIKGALARLIRLARGLTDRAPLDAQGGGPLASHFSRIVVTHAFPSADGARPRRVPQSLASCGIGEETHFIDMATRKGPLLVEGTAAAFSPDWKTESAGPLVGWPEVTRELRVRTAIDRDKRAAKAEALYAMELVVPKGLVWRGSLDLSLLPDDAAREAVLDELATLTRTGIAGIGRNAAFATISFRPAPTPTWTPRDDGCLVLTLQSPTLLRAPDSDYITSFSDLFPHLTLIRRFVRERVAGAEFLARRFQSGAYKPWLLTLEGSVFVFEAAAGKTLLDSKPLVDQALSTGLRLPQAAMDDWGLSGDDAALWDTCPWIHTNGFGEIRADDPLHWAPLPDGVTLQPFHTVESA